MAISKKTVLITGCSEGGMGWHLANEFAHRGWHVFATLRTPSRAGTLSSTPGVEVLAMDVTSQESINACVEQVREKTGGRLDILYNNAGAQYVLPLSDTTIEAAKRLFDVNVWGLLATTQAFLPLLMASRGTVANAASIRTLMMQAYDGIYGASKSAVDMLSKQMELEFQPLGVKVMTICVGGVTTSIYEKQETNKGFSLPEKSLYKPIESNVRAAAQGDRIPDGMMAPEEFAKRAVGDLVAGKSGDTRRGAFSTTLYYFVSWIPQVVMNRMVRDGTGLDELERTIRSGK